MTLQTPIRDRERGLRGPGLTAGERAEFESKVAAAETIVTSSAGDRQQDVIADGVRAFRRLADSDAVEVPSGMLGANVYALAVAKQVMENGLLTALDAPMQIVSGTVTTVRATVYRLPDDLIGFSPPYDPAIFDQLGQRTSPATAVLGSRRIATDKILARIPLPEVAVIKGQKILIALEFLDAGANRLQINMAFGVADDAEDGWLRGLFRSATEWAALAPGSRVWARLVVSGPATLPSYGLGVSAVHNPHSVPALSNRWGGVEAWRAADGFKEWAIAFRPARAIAPDCFAPIVLDAQLADSIFYRVYRRPGSVISSTAPGSHAQDVLLIADTIAMVDLVGDETVPNPQEMRLPLTGIGLLDPGYTYMVNWSAVNGAGLGLATGDNASADADDTAVAWYGFNSDPRLSILPGQNAAYSVYEVAPTADFARLPIVETVRGLDASALIEGSSVVIEGLELARPGGALAIPRTTLEVTPIAQDIMAETKSVDPAMRHGNAVYLSRKYVSDVLVTRVADSTVLTEGTHYVSVPRAGYLEFVNGAFPAYPAAFDVSITYKGYKRRYDLVYADPITGEVGLVAGTARGTDPEEYLPALPAGKVALHHLLIVPGGVEVIPLFHHRHMVPVGREAEYLAIRDHNRRCLPGLAKLMRMGTDFGLVSNGDSITEIADLVEPEEQLVANTGRDGLAYLQGAIPADTIAANVARFNEDGTPNVSGPIIHIGWNWAIKAAIEARSNCVVTYHNLGIGGTTSAATLVGGLYNGRHPDKLTAIYATGAKLGVIAFGMNELGSATTYANIVAMIAAYRAHGIEPVIVTVPGTNVFNRLGARLRGAWEATNDTLVRAALDTGTAYVPLHMVTGYGCEAALGISRESFSAANTINHDGPYVMKRLGQFCAWMLVD